MSGVRAPLFAGVTGGVGTSTLAAALHGVDTGRYAGGPVDVLVCGVGSLATAARLGVPVLAVVADRAPRLDRLTAGFGAVVTVPEISAWREVQAPDVAGLLAVAPQRRPARLRPYIEALLEITAALLRCGVLEQPARPVRPSVTPAVMARVAPAAVRPVVGPQPIPGPVVPAPVVPAPVVPAPVVPAPVVPGPVVPAPVVPAPVVPAPVVPGPVVPGPVVPGPVVPDGTGPASRRPGFVGRPLWRGLQAVERVPVRRAGPTAPVGGRPRSAADTTEPDDDALESMRVG
ncbi:hypothetical protein ACVGOW_03695 [Pseudonocardia saturnea]